MKPTNKHYVILDLEATCWESRGNKQNEIIEIGAVMVSPERDVIDEFQTFVQPILNPKLSAFCTSLTSIQQHDVDQAPTFPPALNSFLDWIKNHSNDYVLGSWGMYDKNQFKNDCNLHGLDTRWLKPHISLKHQYGSWSGYRKGPGMKSALKKEGFELDGTHHRGIDDARNIAKIFIKRFDDWEFK